jgi:hypothetical protein
MEEHAIVDSSFSAIINAPLDMPLWTSLAVAPHIRSMMSCLTPSNPGFTRVGST